jgi:hypothetical protein
MGVRVGVSVGAGVDVNVSVGMGVNVSVGGGGVKVKVGGTLVDVLTGSAEGEAGDCPVPQARVVKIRNSGRKFFSRFMPRLYSTLL